MANIKTTAAEWEKAREYFEAGLLLREISDKTKIAIPNISKKAKSDGWAKAKAKNEKQTLIATAVTVETAKAILTPVALSVHNEIVDEKTRRLVRLHDIAMQNVEESMLDVCNNQMDYKSRADTILKAKEVIAGKGPETAVQVNVGGSLLDVLRQHDRVAV